jgi:hypothetical protein
VSEGKSGVRSTLSRIPHPALIFVSLTDKTSNHFKDISHALYPLKKLEEKKLLSDKTNVVKKELICN